MILAQSTTDDIRRLHDIWVARLAFEYRCERDDVLAAIQPRPAAQAPVASAPAAAPAVAPAEVVAPRSSAYPAPEPQPTSTPAVQAQAVEPSSIELDDPSHSLPGAERAADRASPPKPRVSGRKDEVARLHAEHPDWTGQQIAAQMDVLVQYVSKTAQRLGLTLPLKSLASRATRALPTPAPDAPLTVKERVKALHDEHPEFTAAMAHAHLGITMGSLAGQSAALKIKWKRVERLGRPKKVEHEETRDELDARVVALHQAEPDLTRPRLAERLNVDRFKINAVVARLALEVPHAVRGDAGAFVPEVIPAATPQTPVAPPPVGEMKTLNDRVRALHHQHPTWTGRMIANELGANAGSVSVALARIRNPKSVAATELAPNSVTGLPNVPAGAEERALKVNYADVRKRLGAPQ